MKRKFFAVLSAAVLALGLAGCSFKDTMLYLYGGDDFVQSEEADYARCDGANGVSVVFDQNTWSTPTLAQADTLSMVAGNKLSYTVVLLQKCDDYTDFLAQSGQELEETTGTVKYDMELAVPDADAKAVRYDCGSYQAIFAQLDYACGETVYVTAAARTSDYQPIVALLQGVYPTGHAPADLPAADTVVEAVSPEE